MNLALLRVFGILIAVHELNRLVRLLLQVTMSGFDEGESFTDIAPSLPDLPLLHGPDGRADFLFAVAEISALHVEHAVITLQDGQACAP